MEFPPSVGHHQGLLWAIPWFFVGFVVTIHQPWQILTFQDKGGASTTPTQLNPTQPKLNKTKLN